MEKAEDRENVEDVEQDDQPTDQVLTPEGMAVKYGKLLEQCLDIAITVMGTHEMLEGEGIDRELQTRIALTIFNRCTRETSGLETMVQMALQYLNLMLQEKVAETERSAEFRVSAPLMPTFGAGFVQVVECEHPGLKALYKQLDVVTPLPNMPAAAIIQAMTLRTGDDSRVEALLCPHCRVLVPLDQVVSGELWSQESEEESAEEEETESVSPVGLEFARSLTSAVCPHRGLHTLYLHTTTGDVDGDVRRAMREVVNTMTVTGVCQRFLLCPDCRSLIPFEAFDSGKPWDDSAEASRKAVSEAMENEMLGPRGRAIKAGLDRFFEEDPRPGTERLAGRPAEEFGPTLTDFYRQVDQVHDSGVGTVTIYKLKSASDPPAQVGKATTEEVIRDRDFLEAVRKEHGDGLYRFTFQGADGKPVCNVKGKVAEYDFIIGEVEEKKKKRKKRT